MDDQKVVGQFDPDHLQDDSPVVGPDPDQTIVQRSTTGCSLRLAGRGRGRQGARALPMRCLRADCVNRTTCTPRLLQGKNWVATGLRWRQFNLRVGEQLHRKLAMEAATETLA